ncbi:MAG TPA: DUF3488 and transglutaminase-like domain-containing protein [Actinomycetales bacterium]|nr:DUF3488 and transglutaminase-like domain-containing protein [Actinomycetales bacterium]
MTILRPIVANLAILAATLSLITVVEFGPWFGWATAVTTGMLAVTTTSRWLLRKRGAQWISLPLALLTAAVFLVRLLTPSKMFAGFIPTMATLHDVGTLLSNASQTFQFSPPPVPANAGVTLVVLSSLVIVTALVDLLALQAHAPAFAALPLLALWTPTIVLAREISLFLVFLSLVTWLALLALERAGRAAWYLSALRTSWALVSAAVVFALVSLLALPALQKWSHWSSFEVAKNPRSTAPIVAGEPVVLSEGVELSHILGERSDETILRYRALGAKPSILRLKVMSDYNDGQWEAATDLDDLEDFPPAPATGLDTEAASVLEVQHTGLVERFGVSPGHTLGIASNARDWRLTRDTGELIHERGAIAAPYEVTWEEPEVSRQALQDAHVPMNVADRWTAVPDDLPDSFYEELKRAKEDATTPYEMAVNIQNWFRSSGAFTYEVTNDEVTGSALDDFFINRSGFCVHYATAMTLMLRHEGIPTRVAVGFLPGQRDTGGWMEVAANRAHAWPEVYFEGHGWIRFEPTPPDQTGQAPDWTREPAVSDDNETPAPDDSPTLTETEPETSAESTSQTSETSPEETAVTQAPDEGSRPILLIVGIALFAAALIVFGVRLRRFRRQQRREGFSQKWDAARQICASVAPDAVAEHWRSSRSPSQIAAALQPELPPEMGPVLIELAAVIERQAFAPGSQPREEAHASEVQEHEPAAEAQSAGGKVDELLTDLRAAKRKSRQRT